MVAATVRSVAHLNSLKNYEIVEKTDEGGSGENEQLLEFTGVTEQRISGLAIHALIGAALLNCRGLLRAIPQAVLTGLFLFLGVSSVDTTDLWSRTLLFISDEVGGLFLHAIYLSIYPSVHLSFYLSFFEIACVSTTTRSPTNHN
jgi:hypothetical protein